MQLPTLSKAVGETLKSLTEMQIHKIVSLARKYQRRAHHLILTGAVGNDIDIYDAYSLLLH